MSNKKKIIIIGSGLAGLTAAHQLKNIYNILLLDKGNYVGGRICTRITKNHLFNHGAQFFSANSKKFLNLLKCGKKNKVLTDRVSQSGKKVFIGSPNMRSFMNWYSEGIKLIQKVHIEKIEYNNDKFNLFSRTEEFKSDGLILTPPSKQTSTLLSNILPNLTGYIDQVKYHPCICLMIKLNKKNEVKLYPKLNKVISLVNFEKQSKQEKEEQSVTIHTTHNFSKKYLNIDDDKIINKILNEFTFNYKVEKKNIDVISLHRWLFSKVHKPISIDINNQINELPLAVAGDWNPGIYDNQIRGLGNRAEDAYLSGLQAARHIDLKFKKK